MRNENRLRKILLLIVSVVTLYFLVKVGYSTYITWQQENIASSARKTYENSIGIQPTATPTPKPTATPPPEPTTPVPPEQSEKAIRPEFEALLAKYNNEDIVGYLKIENTTMDYPVLQSTDNEYYLTRDINKNNSIVGSLFLDYENDIGKEDRNSIIYGHNMNQDIMFHSLRKYQDESFYKEHKYINFNTLYDNCVYEVFAAYVTNISFNYIIVNFPSDEAFMQTVNTMIEKSNYQTGLEVSAQDRVLTLSTCSNVNSDTRIVVNAKLISINGRDYAEILKEREDYNKAVEEYNNYSENKK